MHRDPDPVICQPKGRISDFSKACGANITAHDLRRAFARSLAEQVTPAVLAAMCGWSRIQTAEKYYLDLQTMKGPAPAAIG